MGDKGPMWTYYAGEVETFLGNVSFVDVVSLQKTGISK